MSIKMKPVDIDKLRVKIWISRSGHQEGLPSVLGLSCEEIVFDKAIGDCSDIESIKIFLMSVKREWREYLVSDFSQSSCNEMGLSYTINKNSEAKFKQDFLFARCK